MEDNSVHYKIAVQDKSGGRTLYYQDLSSTREGFYFKEAEDLAKRYFKSITNKL